MGGNSHVYMKNQDPLFLYFSWICKFFLSGALGLPKKKTFHVNHVQFTAKGVVLTAGTMKPTLTK